MRWSEAPRNRPRAASLGAEIKPVRVPDIAALNAVGQVILLSEASAVLQPYLESRALFGADVLTRLDQGRLIPATDYINAQRIRRRLRVEFDKLWSEVDCILTPTTPNTAPAIGQTTVKLGGRDEDARLAATRLARGINVLGLPALSIPCGLSRAGLPVGLQILGAAFDEATILKVGAAMEDGGVGIPQCPVS